MDCYRNVKDSTGPWYCELCEEFLSSSSSGAAAVNSWEKPYFAAECGLCGGSPGAFRKSIDGQWVHAFCAEVKFSYFIDYFVEEVYFFSFFFFMLKCIFNLCLFHVVVGVRINIQTGTSEPR